VVCREYEQLAVNPPTGNVSIAWSQPQDEKHRVTEIPRRDRDAVQEKTRDARLKTKNQKT
jgi:hypothetical protein